MRKDGQPLSFVDAIEITVKGVDPHVVQFVFREIIDSDGVPCHRLIHATTGPPPRTFQCELFFDPALGLVDVDFHPVTEAGWQQLKSAHPEDAARLMVPPHVPISEVQEALADIRSRIGSVFNNKRPAPKRYSASIRPDE